MATVEALRKRARLLLADDIPQFPSLLITKDTLTPQVRFCT